MYLYVSMVHKKLDKIGGKLDSRRYSEENSFMDDIISSNIILMWYNGD